MNSFFNFLSILIGIVKFIIKKFIKLFTPAYFLKPSEWLQVKKKLNHKLNTCRDNPNYNDLLQLFHILDRRIKTKDFSRALETEKNYTPSTNDPYGSQALLFRINMSTKMFRFCLNLLRGA